MFPLTHLTRGLVIPFTRAHIYARAWRRISDIVSDVSDRGIDAFHAPLGRWLDEPKAPKAARPVSVEVAAV